MYHLQFEALEDVFEFVAEKTGTDVEELSVYVDNDTLDTLEDGLKILDYANDMPASADLGDGRKVEFVVTENAQGFWLDSEIVA